MFRALIATLFSFFMLVSCQGCFLLLAGAAGGAGTAVWLSGKLTQEVNVPYEQAIDASRKALRSMKLPIEKETMETAVTQIKSAYEDGRTIWVDIRKVTESASRIEVRVGMTGDKAAAQKVMSRIKRYL